MNVLVIGATGRVGCRVVTRAVDVGHDVSVFVRDPGRIEADTDRLTVFEGDVRERESLVPAIRGQDAVVSALGSPPGGDAEVLSRGIETIIDAMAETGVRRLVAIAAAGVLQADEGTLRLNAPDFPVFLQQVAGEHRRVYERLQRSELDWTLVCPPNMPDGELTGEFRTRINYLPADGREIATGDVAVFVCDTIERDDLVRKRVGIAY